MRNEAVNIINGETPDINTGKTAQVTPTEKEAAVAINGAIDHINQVTLFGIVWPLNIERMYPKAPSKEAKPATSTIYSSIYLLLETRIF